ncbi:MAG: cysteine dioxygenase family protein [Phycisphaerales bacterium]
MHAGLSDSGADAVEELFGHLASDDASREDVTEALRSLRLTADDVGGCSPYQPGHRVRCELARTKAWVLLALLWDRTTTSIHDHCESECGFRIVEGEIEETRFRCDGDQAHPISTHKLMPGDFVTTPGSTVHQLGTKGRAISIHAYAPALCLDDMQVFERA